MASQAMESARRFLEHRRIAFVGLSRDPKSFSRFVFRELAARGYDLVPVHPEATELEGRRCFARMQDIDPPVAAALFLTPPARTEQAVRDGLPAGVRHVWMHRGGGPGSATPAAVALCRASGIEVVTDLCPFMALPKAGLPHRVHGFFRRLAMRGA